jgi:hypothetical protein
MLLDLDGKAKREASRADDGRLPNAQTYSDGSGQASDMQYRTRSE